MTSPSKEPKMEDKLSELPDSILCHILSFLPTNEAIQTTLIKRFGSLWTHLPNLDFDDDLVNHLWPENQEINTNFFQFVQNTLLHHERPTIETFKLNIQTMLYQDIESQQLRDEIDSWLTFAIQKKVKVLEFGFGLVEPEIELYNFPFKEFISESIEELKLVHIEMKGTIRVQLGSIRVLKLVYMSLSDEIFREIIKGCPYLKELEISNCWDLSEVKSSILEVLKVDREFIAWDEIMRIDCPKLLSFSYNGCVDGLGIVDSLCLDWLNFRLNLRITEQEFSNFAGFQSVLNKLLNAKSVTLSTEFVTVMLYCSQIYVPQTMVNWKEMEMNIWLTKKHTKSLCILLNNAPSLEKLVLNVTFWHADFLKVIESELDTNNQDKEEYSWGSLKSIIIRNASMSSYCVMIRLVEILLKSSPSLNQLIICYATNKRTVSESEELTMTLEQFKGFSDKVLTLPKASKTVQVLLL